VDGDGDVSSSSVQLGGEDSVLVVDKLPNRLCVSNQSNNNAKKDTVSDLTTATPNERKCSIVLKSKAIWKSRITETIMGYRSNREAGGC
jgi:hypothetical protein